HHAGGESDAAHRATANDVLLRALLRQLASDGARADQTREGRFGGGAAGPRFAVRAFAGRVSVARRDTGELDDGTPGLQRAAVRYGDAVIKLGLCRRSRSAAL